jgi:hypothetical protein
MLLTSFGHSWRNQIHGTQSTSTTTGLPSFFSYRPADLLFGDAGYETSTQWNYKVIGRYILPFDVGVSGSWKVQSGIEWGRTVEVRFPGDGTRTVRVEPVTTNRAPMVGILDFRFDKSINIRGTRLVGMVDIFNATNSGSVTNFRTTTVNYQEVTGILDPRVLRLGVRFNF